MKHITCALLIILICCFFFTACTNIETPIDNRLCFDEEGKFVILQFADFHEWAGVEKGFTIDTCDSLKPLLKNYIISTLDSVKPDLVVLTGDNIFCLSWLDKLYNVSENTMKYIAEIFESRGISWTFTFGNHDTEGGISKIKLIKAVQKYSCFVGGLNDGKNFKALSFKADKDDFRAGNYSIPVYSPQYDMAEFNIFMLDCGSYTYKPDSSIPYRYILDLQTDWYATQSEALKAANGGVGTPSILFTHIPLIEHNEAYQQGNQHIGIWNGISASTTRSSIFSAAIEQENIQAIFAGHNHNNSFTGFYMTGTKKIMMGITPQAAAHSYSDNDSIMYSRVISITRDGNFLTYIHTSDSAYLDNIYRSETLSFN